MARSRGATTPIRLVSSAPRAGCATRAWTAAPRSCRTTRRTKSRACRRWTPPPATCATCARPGTARTPKRRSTEQAVTVTIPASFDPGARELTLDAARRPASRLTLLEEPQAALYSWIQGSGGRWRKQVAAGRHHPGGRRGRRHQRLFADRRPRTRRQAGTAPRRRRRPHPARRRQYGPGAGPPGGPQAGRQRHAARRLADARADLRLPQRQGSAAGRRRRRRRTRSSCRAAARN